MAINHSNLSVNQVLEGAFNVDNQTLRVNALVPEAFDYIAKANTSAAVETYTYKLGGSGGTLVATITITYVDSSKADIVSVART